MILRRQAVLGGLLALVSSPTGGCQSTSAIHGLSAGCIVEGARADEILARSSTQQLYASGNEAIVASSGDRHFDYALAQTLSRLTDTLQVLPGFAYYDDYDGKNALATTKIRLARADGTVLFGTRLLKETLQELEYPDVAVAAICAHEFGHIVQFKLKLLRRLVRGQQTIKPYELHADFLAGYFAGVRKREKADYPAAVFATKAYSLGDHDVDDKNHHGRPDERASAIVRGFQVAYHEKRSLSDAIEIGIQYVSG